MTDLFIIISKYLFILYITVFVFAGFMINLSRQDIIKINIPMALSNQRICIILFHITASIVLITSSFETDLIIYCVLGLALIILGSFLAIKIYPNSSHLLYNCIFFIMDIGLMMLYRLNSELGQKQLIWNGIGVFMLLICPKIFSILPRLDLFKKVYIIIAFALLISTLIFGFASGGSKNWISFGPIGFQPSELIKIFFVFYLASAFSKNTSIKNLIKPTILSGIVVILLVGGQNDLGSALIFYMTFLVMLFISTNNYLYFFGGVAFISVASNIAYQLFSHIRVRVEAWQNPWLDVANKGYQIAQSLFAICTWQVTGIGFTRGYANSIPVVERDFIYAAICEEFGIIFGVFLILIFMLIILEGSRGAIENKNKFLSLVCFGLTSIIAVQSFLIIGGVIKFIPLTGVTLPFISYGGTSIVISYILISIIQWITIRNEIYSSDKRENISKARKINRKKERKPDLMDRPESFNRKRRVRRWENQLNLFVGFI